MSRRPARLDRLRRGPRRPPPAAQPTSWSTEALPIAEEHRESLAEAETDASYRWAAAAVRGRDVLVVGCGPGHGAALLERAGARSVVGVDPDERAVEIATRLYGEALRFAVAEPMALPLAEGSFDAVTCFGVLEGAPDPEAVLTNLTRVLTDDGVLLVSVPAPVAGAAPAAPEAERDGGRPAEAPERWRDMLDAGFGNVRAYRLGIRLAATVAPSDARGEVALDEAAWLASDASEDRTTLFAASNSHLPELPSVASMTGFRDLRAYRATLAAWEERARRAEADGSAKHWELVASREAQRRLRKRLHTLEHRPLRVISRVLRGKPARVGPGPPIRASEREPEPWD